MGEKTKQAKDWIKKNANAYSWFDNVDEKRKIMFLKKLQELDEDKTVSEMIRKIADKSGFVGNDEKNIDSEMAAFLSQKCKDRLGKDFPNRFKDTIYRWIENGAIRDNINNRENIYILFFGLGLNLGDVKEFFAKGYLRKPFNFGTLEENVYYCCFKAGLAYSDAKEIIDEIDANIKLEEPNGRKHEFFENWENRASCNSALLCNDDLADKEEIIEYFKTNSSLFVRSKCKGKEKNKENYRSTSANNMARKLLFEIQDKLAKYSESEETINGDTYTPIILKEIYGFYPSPKNGENIISNSKFPKGIKNSILNATPLSKIKKGNATEEEARKAIILFVFFLCWGIDDTESYEEKSYEDFCYHVDEILSKCGLNTLYERNSFDFLVCYCASSEDPMGTWQDIFRVYCN